MEIYQEMLMDTAPHFPDPPPEMNLRVERSSYNIVLIGFHTISQLNWTIQKYVLVSLGVIAIGLGFFWLWPVMSQQNKLAYPVAVNFDNVLFGSLMILIFCVVMFAFLFEERKAGRDREDWSIQASNYQWPAKIRLEQIYYDNEVAVTHEVKIIQPETVTQIVVDQSRQVCVQRESDTVRVTRSLIVQEAEWVKEALGNLQIETRHLQH